MPLGRGAAHKICASAWELAKTLISKEALKSFQRGVGFLIRWQLRVCFNLPNLQMMWFLRRFFLFFFLAALSNGRRGFLWGARDVFHATSFGCTPLNSPALELET